MKRNLIHLSAYSAVKNAWPFDRSLSMKTGKTQGYLLTFRCINCGKHRVFAQYPSGRLESEARIRSDLPSKLQFVWLEGRCLRSFCHSYFAYDGTQGEGCGTGSRVVKQQLAPDSAASQHRQATGPLGSAVCHLRDLSGNCTHGQLSCVGWFPG